MIKPNILILLSVAILVVVQSTNCDQNCISCTNGKCNQCEQLYYPSGSTCQTCPKNCIQCTSSTNCQSCVYTYYSDAGTCKRCSDSCIYCDDIDTCTRCVNTYYLSAGKCQACSNGCDACTSASGCQSCSAKYYFNGSTCVSCHSLCGKCDHQIGCLTCQQGYYLDSQTCKSCQENCAICSNNQTCQTCTSGYYLLNNVCLSCNSCSDKAKCIKENICLSALVSSETPTPSKSGFTIAIQVITPMALGLFLFGCCFYVAMKGRGRNQKGNTGVHTDVTVSTAKNLKEEGQIQNPPGLRITKKQSQLDLDYDGDAIHSTDTI